MGATTVVLYFKYSYSGGVINALKKKMPKEEKLKKRPLTHQHQILSFGTIA